MKALILLPALLLAAPAFAGDAAITAACPGPNSFIQKIYNCGKNDLAVEHARECSQAVMQSASVAGASLAKVMQSLQSSLGSAQNRSMTDLVKRLRISIKSLEAQILMMQDKTNLVASYDDAMINFPDAENDDSSPECFTDNFHALQKIVDQLDNEIINAKNARLEALRLLDTASQRNDDLGNEAEGVTPVTGESDDQLPTPTARRHDGSGISGTEKLKKEK